MFLPKEEVQECLNSLFYSANEEQGDKLESQLKEDKFTMAESERRFEDIARKLATMEGELERSLDRCNSGKSNGICLIIASG